MAGSAQDKYPSKPIKVILPYDAGWGRSLPQLIAHDPVMMSVACPRRTAGSP